MLIFIQYLFDCLVVLGFTSHSWIFPLYGDVSITGEGFLCHKININQEKRRFFSQNQSGVSLIQRKSVHHIYDGRNIRQKTIDLWKLYALHFLKLHFTSQEGYKYLPYADNRDINFSRKYYLSWTSMLIFLWHPHGSRQRCLNKDNLT